MHEDAFDPGLRRLLNKVVVTSPCEIQKAQPRIRQRDRTRLAAIAGRAAGESFAISVALPQRRGAFAAFSARFDRDQILPRPVSAVTAASRKRCADMAMGKLMKRTMLN